MSDPVDVCACRCKFELDEPRTLPHEDGISRCVCANKCTGPPVTSAERPWWFYKWDKASRSYGACSWLGYAIPDARRKAIDRAIDARPDVAELAFEPFDQSLIPEEAKIVGMFPNKKHVTEEFTKRIPMLQNTFKRQARLIDTVLAMIQGYTYVSPFT
jgi:hypothetical protein